MQTTSTTQQLLKKFLCLVLFTSLFSTISFSQSGQQCFVGTTHSDVYARQTWSVNNTAGTVTIRTTFSKNFVDNTYGANAVGWKSGHKFNDLVGSDHLQLALYNSSNVKTLEFKMDYISASTSAPSGYKTLGVSGGDGKMILGNASDIVSVKTSLDSNFNGYGYVLTSNSPATDANYTPNPAYPKWIFDVWYEVTVKLSAFGGSFGKAEIASVHASPSKTGSNTEVVNPGPCPSPESPTPSCPSCVLGYPDNSNLPRSAQVFNESEVLRAFEPGPSICGTKPEYIKLWYNDEHALTLGVRQVNVKTSGGTTTTNYPITPTPASPTCVDHPVVGTTIQSGDQSGNDVAVDGGRPLWPALFITDLTVNGPTSRAGDWQQGGTAIAPSKICGTWKAAVRTVDKTKNPQVVTVTPDADPAKNDWNLGGGDAPPAGTANEGYGAVIYWKISELNLIPGHSYRLQFMVHDGDQNKAGGDVGDTCTTITIPPSQNPSSIGDFVWDDQNQNGKQDVGEPGVPNVLVKLYDEAGDLVDATVTNAQGKYIFNNVSVSNTCPKYMVEFSNLPNQYTFTFKNANGTTADNNSDADRTTGQTDMFPLCPDQSHLDIDAGIFNPGGPLPVNIGQLIGKSDAGVSKLNWISYTETNLSAFDVQRSVDGVNFTTIGSVKAAGTSSSSNTYNFTDNLPVAGNNYYRLKVNDKSSAFAYSNVIALNVALRGLSIRGVFPNPFSDKVSIDIITENDQPVQLKVTDLAGRVIRKQTVQATKGSNTFNVNDLKSLNSGVYLVEVRAGATVVTKKLYKE